MNKFNNRISLLKTLLKNYMLILKREEWSKLEHFFPILSNLLKESQGVALNEIEKSYISRLFLVHKKVFIAVQQRKEDIEKDLFDMDILKEREKAYVSTSKGNIL